jgi:hypothetical protein
MEQKNKSGILIAVIGAITAVIVALIQFWPHRSQPDTTSNEKPGTIKAIESKHILRGTIVDEVSNDAIGMAELTLVGRNETYFSEVNGNFKIDVVDDVKEVRVRVTKKKYKINDKSYDLPGENLVIKLERESNDK